MNEKWNCKQTASQLCDYSVYCLCALFSLHVFRIYFIHLNIRMDSLSFIRIILSCSDQWHMLLATKKSCIYCTLSTFIKVDGIDWEKHTHSKSVQSTSHMCLPAITSKHRSFTHLVLNSLIYFVQRNRGIKLCWSRDQIESWIFIEN